MSIGAAWPAFEPLPPTLRPHLADSEKSVLAAARAIPGRRPDEELSRRRRGDPRSLSQAQDRLHHVVAGLGMVADLGGAGARQARQQAWACVRRILARD